MRPPPSFWCSPGLCSPQLWTARRIRVSMPPGVGAMGSNHPEERHVQLPVRRSGVTRDSGEERRAARVLSQDSADHAEEEESFSDLRMFDSTPDSWGAQEPLEWRPQGPGLRQAGRSPALVTQPSSEMTQRCPCPGPGQAQTGTPAWSWPFPTPDSPSTLFPTQTLLA